MGFEKLTNEDIVDTVHITELHESTGEVVSYTKGIYSKRGMDKLENNKKLVLSQKELHLYLRQEFGNFYFYFYNKLDKYDIKPQYKLRFLYLASHLDYNNGSMIIRGEYNTKIRLNRQTMKDILMLKGAEFNNTVKVLSECDLLIKDGKYYDLNTDCSSKGNVPKNKKDYTRVFIKTIRDLYGKCEPKNHKQLYYIFKILPFVNLQFNIPCHNTDCETMNLVEPMKLPDVCDAIGYDRSSSNKLWKLIRGFKINGDYVVCKHTIDDKEYIAINPRVYYAGTRIENASYLTGIFDMAK